MSTETVEAEAKQSPAEPPRVPHVQSQRQIATKGFAMAKYAKEEIDQWTEDDSRNPAESIDFVFTPFAVERLILFGMLVCADSFIFLLAFLPVRAAIALFTFFKSLLTGRRPLLLHLNQVDLMRLALLGFGLLSVWHLDLARLSQVVKITEIKLKMIWMALEFLNKAMTRWGESILHSLVWSMQAKREDRKWPVWWHFVVACGYMAVHPFLLLFHLSVLNLAVAGKSTSFFSLVVLVQFAELKSFGLKTTDARKLTDMCHEDVCERFELLVLVLALFVHNAWPHFTPVGGMPYLLALLAILYFSEMIIDWLKHSAICNTNNLNPGVYLSRLSDLAHPHTHKFQFLKNSLTDTSLALARRIGFWPLPISVVVLKVAYEAISRVGLRAGVQAVLGTWACMLVLHFALRSLVHLASNVYFFRPLDNWLQLHDNLPEKEKEK
jgi:hypothetical protein